jgi:hypothetical protein
VGVFNTSTKCALVNYQLLKIPKITAKKIDTKENIPQIIS